MHWALTVVDPDWHPVIRDAWREREGVRHCVKIRQRARDNALRETHRFLKYGVVIAGRMHRVGT